MKSILLKRLAFLLLLLSAFHFAKAQSWDPLASNYRCNYGFHANEPTVTLWNDSVHGIGDFTVHYLKKVCRQIDNGSFKDYFLLINQPTFLLSQYRLDPKQIIFSDPKTKASYKLLLYGTAPFVFDSINNITSQLVTNDKIKLFGNIDDSIKVYKLSNADTIILSKDHGMIKFPSFNDHKHYQLLGLENLGGIQIPKFNDFFDFNIGDAFEYKIIEECATYPNYINTTLRRLTILYKKIKGDSLIYTCDVKQRKTTNNRIYQTKDTIYTQKTDTLIFINYPNSFINKYPGEVLSITEHIVNPLSLYFDKTYNSLVKSYEGVGGYPYFLPNYRIGTDTFEIIRNKDIPSNLESLVYLEDVDSKAEFFFKPYCSMRYKYAKDLGMIEKGFSGMSGHTFLEYKLQLTAAKTENRQYGKFTDPSILTSTPTIASVYKLMVYPNPANTYLMIENRQGPKEMIVSISSTDGKELMKQTITGEKTKLDIQQLKKGIYFIKIEQDKSFEVRKIVKE